MKRACILLPMLLLTTGLASSAQDIDPSGTHDGVMNLTREPGANAQLLQRFRALPLAELADLLRRDVDVLNFYTYEDDYALASVPEAIQAHLMDDPRQAMLYNRIQELQTEERERVFRLIKSEIQEYLKQRTIATKIEQYQLLGGVAFPLLLVECDTTGDSIPVLLAWYLQEQCHRSQSQCSEEYWECMYSSSVRRFIATAIYAAQQKFELTPADAPELANWKPHIGRLSWVYGTHLEKCEYFWLASAEEAERIYSFLQVASR